MQYIAKGLEELLCYWEWCNKDAEQNFANLQYCKNNGFFEKTWKTEKGTMSGEQIVGHFFQTPEIGSEVTRIGKLRRNIPNYQNLRRLLNGNYDGSVEEFLPRVPKVLRHVHPHQFSFLQKLHDSNFHIPYYLWQWNQTRRAIAIDDSEVKVPIVDLREENWLSKTPYPTFYLHVQETFVLHYEQYELHLNHFLIHDAGDEIGILVWSKDPASYMMSPDMIARDQEIIKQFLSKKEVDVNKYISQDDLDETKLAPCAFHLKVHKYTRKCKMYEYKDIYEPTPDATDIYDPELRYNDPYKGFFVKVIEYINGVYKTLASLPAQTKKESETLLMQHTTEKPREKRDWYSLPLQYVDQLVTERSGEKMVFRRTTGAEKSPHFRRGHWRRYVSKDGTINEVWIEMMIVREDKLDQQISGGATKVRRTA
jgi:hypothetical protein